MSAPRYVTMYENVGHELGTGPAEGFLWNTKSGIMINWTEVSDDDVLSPDFEWYEGPKIGDDDAMGEIVGDASDSEPWCWCDDVCNGGEAAGLWFGELSGLVKRLGPLAASPWLRVESVERGHASSRQTPSPREALLASPAHGGKGEAPATPIEQYARYLVARNLAADPDLSNENAAGLIARYDQITLMQDTTSVCGFAECRKPLMLPASLVEEALSGLPASWTPSATTRWLSELPDRLGDVWLAALDPSYEESSPERLYLGIGGACVFLSVGADAVSMDRFVDADVDEIPEEFWRGVRYALRFPVQQYVEVTSLTPTYLANSLDYVDDESRPNPSQGTLDRQFVISKLSRICKERVGVSVDEARAAARDDLLKAYDAYVHAFGDSGYAKATGGWPLSVGEFERSEEYTRIWREERSFDYLYDNALKFEEVGERDAGVKSLADQMARVMGDDDGQEPGQSDGRDEI